MAGGSFSSTTSTSQTLSVDPTQLPTADIHSSSTQALISTLSASPHTFLQPPPSLHSAALVLAKRFLDPLASSVREAQLHRQRDVRKKRKRGEDESSRGQVLQLNKLYLDGFGIDQVWEQARRVLDAARQEVERSLPQVVPSGKDEFNASTNTNGDGAVGEGLDMMQLDEDGFEIDASDDDLGEEGVDYEIEDNDVVDDEEMDDGQEGNTDPERDVEAEDEESDNEDEALSEDEEPVEIFEEDPNGLNDGFFSINNFNKYSEFLERRDAAGDPFDGAASDEEEIDWDVDPMTMAPEQLRKKSVDDDGDLEGEDEEDEDGDDEGGPTFGDANINAPEGDSEDGVGGVRDEDDGMADKGDMANTNDVLYKDFFAPPARKASDKSRPSSARILPKSRPTLHEATEENGDDIQRTMSAVRRDLFEDELSANEDASVSELDPSDLKSRRSNHERRQAKIAEEIRKLEAANVAKREWTLSGEARAADRPLNSLLEEDLDFERTGKPVPVITNEVSEGIEELIKRRILTQDFDEVIRRRPDSLTAPNANTRRGRFELDDTKPQQSLAEIYEADHLRKTDPGSYTDKRDEKLKKEHAEIEALWVDVSAKLDALSSWHYKPRPAAPSVNIVADVPTVTIEDARPTAGGEVGEASMLAPQEIYAPGKESAGAGEVVPKSGAPVGREEMSREEKVRRRRREKERIKKSGVAPRTSGTKNGESKKTKEKKEIVGDLKKGGVKVIGRKGEIRDVEGKAFKARNATVGAGSFKL
ncbi:MAG: U3 snoRNP protein [Pycnora praestabilis]|nr:MAG: U3 snoRNP protein [Pycnora praestabilis]